MMIMTNYDSLCSATSQTFFHKLHRGERALLWNKKSVTPMVRIYGVLKAIYVLYMHVHTNDVIISQSNSIANN